jgi:hypothetical protein
VLRKVRSNITRRKLHKKFPPKSVERKIFDFETASTAGILYHVSDSETELALNEFTAFLKQRNISVTTLGYFHGKNLPQDIKTWKDIRFITRKDCDWLRIPNPGVARDFVEKEFDLLINCSMRRFRVLDHLVQCSAAACKIGPDSSSTGLFDITIRVSGDNQVRFFLENLKRYLPLINRQCTLTQAE